MKRHLTISILACMPAVFTAMAQPPDQACTLLTQAPCRRERGDRKH